MQTGRRGWFGVVVVLGLITSAFGPGAVASAQGLPGGDWSPAAGAAGDNTYEGFIDQPGSGATVAAGSSFPISGWVVDTSAEGWAGIDDVQVLVGNTVLTHATVGLSRPDVASLTGNPYFANAGFAGVVSGGVPGGTQTLTVLAHTPGKGSWAKQVTINVTGASGVITSTGTESALVLNIISPTTDDIITANNNGTIYGVAYDTRTTAALGAGVDRVEAYLDGERGVAGSQFLGDATITGNTWSVAWEPTKYNHVTHHVLFVYARSAVTGEERLLTEEINISH